MIGSFPREPNSEAGLLGLGKGVLEKKKNSYNLKTSVQLKKDYHFNYEILGVKSCLIVVHLPKQNYTMFM